MNHSSQQSSRRLDFALLDIDLVEKPDFFTDEHLHEHFRNLEIDLESDDFDHFDQPHVHEPSWGKNHRSCRRRRRIHSDAAAVPSPSMADILGHDDSVASSLSSSSSSFREDDLFFLLGPGRDSISLAGRRGVPALLSIGSYSRDEEGGGGDDDESESFDAVLPFLNRDSLSLASRRGVPKSSRSKGEDDDGGGADASDDSHFFALKNNGEDDDDWAASCTRGESDQASRKRRNTSTSSATPLIPTPWTTCCSPGGKASPRLERVVSREAVVPGEVR